MPIQNGSYNHMLDFPTQLPAGINKLEMSHVTRIVPLRPGISIKWGCKEMQQDTLSGPSLMLLKCDEVLTTHSGQADHMYYFL